ncbi:unnamed protein product [Lactuca virosa]|uniref:Ubiquitin-like protease family profile domain-containing protein n=1 Tax=Lactuca virosa TaxID=75947 RepID=A0AAU9P5U4_9ASTR|nr:unnamed protein product [Lactuca virosa]
MPSFSLGLGLGLTQEFQEMKAVKTNKRRKKEKMKNLMKKKVMIQKKQNDNNILGIEDHLEGKRDVEKRLKKPSLKVSSPYNQKEVFFPVHKKNHFYIICINLEEPAVDVIDNRNSVAKFSRAYRDAPNELKILFSRYLMRVNHKSALIMEGVEPERVNMNW